MAKKVKKTSKKTYTRHSALSVIGKVLKGFVIFTLLVVMVGSVYAGSIVLGIAKSAPEADIEKFLALSAQRVLLDDQEAVMDTVISNEVRIPIQLAEMGQTVQMRSFPLRMSDSLTIREWISSEPSVLLRNTCGAK